MSDFNAIVNHIKVTTFNDCLEAIDGGYNYSTNIEFAPAQLKEAVVIREGTLENNSTVDLIFEDKNGNKYVAMITANLLRTALSAAK